MCKNGVWMCVTDEQNLSAILYQTACKSWSCPDCAEINKARWRWRVIEGAKQLRESGNDMLQFVTLTNHEALSADYIIEKLPHQWDKLRKRMKRAEPQLQYVVLPEHHKNDRLHLHAIITADLRTRWYKDNARECGMGYMAEAETLDTPEYAGFYATKYMTKQLESSKFVKGFHRVRTSKGWPKFPNCHLPDSWRFQALQAGVSLERYLSSLEAQGYCVALADDRASWALLEHGELTAGASWLTLSIPQFFSER